MHPREICDRTAPGLSPQTTAAPTGKEVTLSPSALSTTATSVSAAAASEAIVTVNCHCSPDDAADDCQKLLETGGATKDPDDHHLLYPGLVNGAEVEGGDYDEDDKDSGNGSVLEFVPPSEFQVSPR